MVQTFYLVKVMETSKEWGDSPMNIILVNKEMIKERNENLK